MSKINWKGFAIDLGSLEMDWKLIFGSFQIFYMDIYGGIEF
jgi:hypothetical protein